MMNNETQALFENLKIDISSPEWAHFPLRAQLYEPRYSPVVLIDHYLIVLVHDYESDEEEMLVDHEPAVLLAVNLHDKSVQKAKIPLSMFICQSDYSFTKYQDNQIIKYGGRQGEKVLGNLVQITVQSFDRIFSF